MGQSARFLRNGFWSPLKPLFKLTPIVGAGNLNSSKCVLIYTCGCGADRTTTKLLGGSMKSKMLVAALTLVAGIQRAYADYGAKTDTLVPSAALASAGQLEQQRGTFTILNLLPLVKVDLFSQSTGTIFFIQSPTFLRKQSIAFPRPVN